MKQQRSADLYDRAFEVMPGGMSSDERKSFDYFPLYYDRGQGSHIWDVDGNEYIDYVLAWGALILGHSPPEVVKAVADQARKGLIFGGHSELEILVAEKIPLTVRSPSELVVHIFLLGADIHSHIG